LAMRKAIMFGTYWCPYCDEERQALGKDVFSAVHTGDLSTEPSVLYVECDAKGRDAQPELCRATGVRVYPTWALTDSSNQRPYELFPGFKGLSGLERIAGLPVEPDPGAVAPPVEGHSGPREMAVADMVAARGGTMYGAYWCRFCDLQRQLFGREAWNKVPYVECDERSAGARPALCDSVGIKGFPEWVLPDGRHVGGILSLERLESLMGETEASGTSGESPARTTGSTALAMPGVACEDCKIGEEPKMR